MTTKRKLKKRDATEKAYHKARDALDESLLKARGALSLLMAMANNERTEEPEALQGVIWLVDDELERLDEAVSDVVMTLQESRN